MKSFLLVLATIAMTFAAQAQTMNIQNSSACDIRFYVAATDPGCTANASTIQYVLPAGGSMTLTFGSATWSGTTPGLGWQWQFIKAGNFCGPYNYTFPVCTSTATANDNVVVMGIPCSGFGQTNCATMTTSCNNPSCNWIRCSWSTFGGNVQVNIG